MYPITVVHLYLTGNHHLTATFEYDGVARKMEFNKATEITDIFELANNTEFQKSESRHNVKWFVVFDPHPLYHAVVEAFYKELMYLEIQERDIERAKEELRQKTPCYSCKELHPNILLCPQIYCQGCKEMFYKCNCEW